MSAYTYYCWMVWLTVVGFGGVIATLLIMLRTRAKQFDCRRRENTVELLMQYAQNIEKETRLAAQIVSGFDAVQCENLYNFKPVTIKQGVKEQFCMICPLQCGDAKTCTEKSEIEIKGKALVMLRYHIIKHLNLFETVAVAYRQQVIDKDVIASEFSFLKDKDTNRALEKFRAVSKSYPAIENFYKDLEEEKKKNEEQENNKTKKGPLS